MNNVLNISKLKIILSIYTLFIDDFIVRNIIFSARNVVIRNINNINKILKISKLFKRKIVNNNLRVELSFILNQITSIKK